MRYQQLPYSPELDELQQAGLLYYGIVGKDKYAWYKLYPHQLSPSACHGCAGVKWRYAVQVED